MYMFLGAVASLLSSMKIVQTRRKLQATKNYKVSFAEAVVHTVFDAVDRFSAELQQVNRVIEQRRLSSSPQLQSIGYYNSGHASSGIMNSDAKRRGHLLALPASLSSSSLSPSLPMNNTSDMHLNGSTRSRVPASLSNNVGSNRDATIDEVNFDPAIASIPNHRKQIVWSWWMLMMWWYGMKWDWLALWTMLVGYVRKYKAS